MADNPADPDWSLLPHDPWRFFGIEAGCDQRELKRRYNELIRRFKPERFPDEFQRIRAAYEQLESAIRYGHSPDAAEAPKESAKWNQLPQRSPATTADANRDVGFAPALPLHEQVRTGDVGAIYHEIIRRPIKTPYDYYALAVISDVVGESGNFTKWILDGLTAYPNEIGLCRLLHAYFVSSKDTENYESMLQACAKIVREDLFYPLTEPLWKRLLCTKDFARFRAVLEQVEANFKGINIDNRLAFYLQILKPAVWQADAEWVEGKFAFIEENHARIPKALDYDVEILSRLQAYLKIRETFIGDNELRRRLDQAMCDYFSEDQLTADQGMLACQAAICDETEKLGEAFADFGNSTYSPFFAVWLWISFDVAQRNIERPRDAIDERMWLPRTREFFLRLQRKGFFTKPALKWIVVQGSIVFLIIAQFLASVVLTGGLVAYGVSAYITWHGSVQYMDAAMIVAWLWGAAMGVYLGYRLARLINRRLHLPFMRHITRLCYQRLWQEPIFRFLAQSYLPYQTFYAYTQTMTGATLSWIKVYVGQDFALPMFALANRFVA